MRPRSRSALLRRARRLVLDEHEVILLGRTFQGLEQNEVTTRDLESEGIPPTILELESILFRLNLGVTHDDLVPPYGLMPDPGGPVHTRSNTGETNVSGGDETVPIKRDGLPTFAENRRCLAVPPQDHLVLERIRESHVALVERLVLLERVFAGKHRIRLAQLPLHSRSRIERLER